jgi:transcriptional regulator with XRE-family HTH domain
MKVLDPKKIKRLMVIQSVTYRELAAAVYGEKATHSYIGRILRGEVTNIKPEHAARIAEYLGVGVDDLFVARLSTDAAHSGKRRRTAA